MEPALAVDGTRSSIAAESLLPGAAPDAGLRAMSDTPGDTTTMSRGGVHARVLVQFILRAARTAMQRARPMAPCCSGGPESHRIAGTEWLHSAPCAVRTPRSALTAALPGPLGAAAGCCRPVRVVYCLYSAMAHPPAGGRRDSPRYAWRRRPVWPRARPYRGRQCECLALGTYSSIRLH